MKKEQIPIRFTLAELEMLNLCLGNGYGDGDFDEWMNNKQQSKDLASGWERITTAINFTHAKEESDD